MKTKLPYSLVIILLGLLFQSQVSRKGPDLELKQVMQSPSEQNAVMDQVIADDLIVQGSACIGMDCVNNENFGFDTERFKENNLRIHFDDTSTSGSFPANDWRIVINDSANGGANYFAVEDASSGRVPFKIEAGAKANALYVDNNGKVGFKTSNPLLDLHTVNGNTPALRLEQDGSSGFAAQTWDMAGNEANFFIRDVTNGSALPFRIKPGSPENSLAISSNGVFVKNALLPGASYPSDRRFKKNIESISDATSVIKTILPKSYFYNTKDFKDLGFDNRKHFGLIAQELQKVLPDLVFNKKFPDGKDYLSVDYNSLIPILIQGFKEQQALIETQQAKINRLETQVSNYASLESRLNAMEKAMNTSQNTKR